MQFRIRIATIFLISLFLLPDCLVAHPHGWITLRTELVVNDELKLTEIHEYWEFDIYYSAATLADSKKASDDYQKGLDKVAQDMIKNLESYHYFSELEIANRPVILNKPRDYSLTTTVKGDQQHLTLFMRFTLESPESINQNSLQLRIFDPSYYIDMSHENSSDIKINTHSLMNCTTRIELPEPSYELIDYASSLDATKRSTQGLGNKFAENVFINCL